MPESLLERSKAKSILDKSDVSKKGEYLEIEPEISNPASLLERAIVKKKPKGEYVEIPYEGEEKPESLSLVERATVKKKGRLHMPHLHFTPEEHQHIHGLAEHIRQKFGITGATPAERVEQLFGHLGHGIKGAVQLELERKKYEMGGVAPTEAIAPSVYAPVRAVPPSEYVRPVEQVVPQEAEIAEMPEAEIPAVSRLGISEKEILICRKLRDVV
jgi:hypothetical protein